MTAQALTYLFVIGSFVIYIGIAVWSRAGSTKEFYIADGGVHPIANGMATAADWMSAASFLSLAGLIAFMGYDSGVYVMGWTGGYVILALLLAPYLRKFGQFTVPDFIGTRYYSNYARVVAVLCLILISFTYVAGQMRGVGIVFSQFLNIPIAWGVLVGMAVVFMYAVLGGMKGITYTQVAQYCILIFAYMVPAIYISMLITGNPIPQIGLGSKVTGEEIYMLDKLDSVLMELGFKAYTSSSKSTIDMFAITMALMIGTAGLPHVIVRFFTVPKVADARRSAAYALLFIALLYATAPAVGAFARLNFISTIHETPYTSAPDWMKKWEDVGLIGWVDKNNDGRVQYAPGKPFKGVMQFVEEPERGELGERKVVNERTESKNEIYVDRDIMVLANPEIAQLPAWVVALVAAGSLAAALSTAAGLLLVISSSISHDLIKKTFSKNVTDRQELIYARIAAATAILVAGYLGINPPGFVAQVVALAFGLAAASLFPPIVLGIFSVRINKEGAISGMVSGLLFTITYIIFFKFISPELNRAEFWLFGISPDGIGSIGAVINFLVAVSVSRLYSPPPKEVVEMVKRIRLPESIEHN